MTAMPALPTPTATHAQLYEGDSGRSPLGLGVMSEKNVIFFNIACIKFQHHSTHARSRGGVKVVKGKS